MSIMTEFISWDFNIYLGVLIAAISFILLSKAASIFCKSNVPGPTGNFLTGQLFEMMKSKDAMQTFDQWVKTYGPIVELRPVGIFGSKIYLVSHAEALKQILVTRSFKYIRPTEVFGPSLGISDKNVLLANGKEHLRMRKMVNPAFKVDNLKTMINVFHDKAQILAKFWNDTISAKSKSGNKEECRLSVQSDISRLSLDALGECVFGCEFNSTEAGDTPVTHAFNDIFGGVNQSAPTLQRKLLQWLPFLKHFFKSSIKRTKALEIISNTIKQVIKDKRAKKTETNTRNDLLDLLLEAVDDETGQGMDEEELHSQLFIFLFAGQETSSLALSWTLYFLAQYPDVQQKLRREVVETFQEKQKSWETYDSMKYLTAVVNESLRLRPPAPIFRRQAVEDDIVLGYNISAGSVIVISPYALHRSPEYWTNPETFNPGRFLEPEKQNNPSNRFAFLPFSTGPRTCIGYRFALIEIKIVLACLIQKFSFSMIPGMSFEGSISITYKPKPALQLLVRKL